MGEHQAIKIVFGILLSAGTIALWLIAFLGKHKYLLQEKKCTSRVKGIIRRYTMASYGGEHAGVHLPVVFYTVNGREYKVVGPEYRIIKTATATAPVCRNNMQHNEENQVLTIQRTVNSFVGIYRNPIEIRYPCNSEIDVYYDPENPKLAYVLRYCNKKWEFWLMFLAGAVILSVDILMLLLL